MPQLVRRLLGVAAAAAAGWGAGGPARVSAHDPLSTTVTWTREIAPLVARRCLACHAAGGYGRFSLATYDEARPWAVAIKELVLAGEMPPWGAAPGVAHFVNDRRPTRHEQELIAAWVDGGAPYSREAPVRPPGVAETQPPAPAATPRPGGTAIPLAPAGIAQATERTASAALQLPPEMQLAAWTFEPGAAAAVESVDLELDARWIGTWTPGEPAIAFPVDAAPALAASALFTARIRYRQPPAPVTDYSRLRVWMDREPRARTVREVTVLRAWRTTAAVEVFALRPSGPAGRAQVIARFASGRAEPLGVFDAPRHGTHPTYRLARALSLPAGARVESTAPVRLLYTTGATRTVNANVSTRPPR